MPDFTLLKSPHEQQKKFLDCTAREQLFGGAKRGGKSAALCMKIILLAYYFPGNRILLCRKDFTDLWDTTLNEFWQVCPPQLFDTAYGKGGHHRGERTIRLRTLNPRVSSDIVYRGLGDWDDIEKVKSLNAGAVAIDEPSEIDYETFKMLRAQLTWVLPNGDRPPYMVLLASNPEPGWVKDRFIENPVEGTAFIPSLPRQNPHLPPGWEQELRDSYDEEWVEKYLDGSWESIEGAVFPELNASHHSIEPIATESFGLIGSIDYAASGISAFVLAGIDHDSNLFALHEHYEADKLISHHARKIHEIIDLYTPKVDPPKIQQKVRYILIDPSCNARTQQGHNNLQSVADQYREHGLNVIPAWNAMEAGLNRIKERLHVKPHHVHPIKFGTVGSPSLFIVKKYCPNLWREMRDYKREILPSGLVRYVGSDHALDNLRYIENSLPRPEKYSKLDQSNRSLQDRFVDQTHNRWAAKWARQTSRPALGSIR